MDPAGVLRAYAQLSGDPPSPETDVFAEAKNFAPYPYGAQKLFEQRAYVPPRMLFSGDLWLSRGSSYYSPGVHNHLGSHSPVAYRDAYDVFAAAEVRAGGQELRVGWLWLSGNTVVDGVATRWCFPALSVPVERGDGLLGRSRSLQPVGDVELTPLIDDPEVRARLFEDRTFGGGTTFESTKHTDKGPLHPTHQSADLGFYYEPIEPALLERLDILQGWARKVAGAVGLEIDEVESVMGASPALRRQKDGIGLSVSYGVYLQKMGTTGAPRDALQRLSYLDNLENSAMARVFSGTSASLPVDDVHQLRPMSARQEQAAGQLLSGDLSVLSGPPGTGKSHLLVVAALLAVARGQSVLVVTCSKHAADVLTEYFVTTPGPTPVVFDGSAKARQLGVQMSELASQEVPDLATERECIAHGEALEREFEQRCLALARAAVLGNDVIAAADARERTERAGDKDEAAQLVIDEQETGRLRWLDRRRLRQELEKRLGEGEPAELLGNVEVDRRALEMIAERSVGIGQLLDELFEIEDAVARAVGAWMESDWQSALSYPDKTQLRELGYAMESPRAERRKAFQDVDPEALLQAAPLWVGTLDDVENVLPEVVGMFDLVIFDEAAQTDPIKATSALVRAKSAVVCGDPYQLQHQSFMSKADIRAAAEENGVDPEAIDPGSQSLFDIATIQEVPNALQEHYRSVPHLIEFSARRFYGRNLHVMTRHPRNDAADHIDVYVVDGRRAKGKVNEAEVGRCLELIDEFVEQGWTSIGLVSPFRAQADALEAAVLERFKLADIDRLGLRVGTVHGFQGDERDVMIASWAVGPDEPEKAWQFVNQSSLFNVMVTRAREHMAVVTSVEKPPGLAGQYVQWAEPLVDIVTDSDVADRWVQQVAAACADAGVRVRTGYRVGHHVVDVVAGVGEHAVAIDCVLHPDGAHAHLDRGLQLRRMGWRTAEAYETQWRGRIVEFVAETLTGFPELRR